MAGRGETEALFEARVDAWVTEALRDGSRTFPRVLRALPGVFPTAVLSAIDRALTKGLVGLDQATRLRQEAAAGEDRSPCRRSLLPLPHPLDYEWRFSPSAGRELLDLSNSLSQTDDEIVLLGTPSVAFEAMSHPLDRNVAFVGPDNGVTGRLFALNAAMNCPINIALCTEVTLRNTAQIVVIDPPWYLDFVRPMMITAAALCREGGYILASLPPAGARSKAALDRTRLFHLAERLSLEVYKEYPLFVEYDTPFFEANALKAAGIGALRAWRRGDLVILRKRVNNAALQLPTVACANHWREIQIGQMRLFVGAASRTGDRGLVSLIPGDILPTVSRRDKRRRPALVWTSGNRIFATDDTELTVAAAIEAIQPRTDRSSDQPDLCGTLDECKEVGRVAALLRATAELEANEERAMRPVGDGGEPWTSAPASSWSGSLKTALG